MFQKEKLIKQSDAPRVYMTDEHKMEDSYASAMKQHLEQTEELQQSRIRIGGITYKDKKEMQNIKLFRSQIASRMYLPVSRNRTLFSKQLDAMREDYIQLIKSCNDYIQANPHPITASGKAQLHLVRGTLSLAEQESRRILVAAEELYKTVQSDDTCNDVVWGNVLGVIRGGYFDLNKADKIEIGGAATSEVKIITSGNKQFYFKENEKLDTAKEEFRKQLLEPCKEQEAQKIYAELYRLMNLPVLANSAFDLMSGACSPLSLQAAQGKELEAMCRDMISILHMERVATSLNVKDPLTQKLMQETFVKYDFWDCRWRACIPAQISSGESLSARNVLSSRMAVIMKQSHLLAQSNVVTLHRGGQQKENGIIMDQAKGVEHEKILRKAAAENKKVVYTPEAMRQFSCLQLLDTICGQIDRHTNNRFVTYNDKNDQIIITGVQGIDNDLAFGTLTYNDIKKFSISHLPAFQRKDQSCSIPAFDKEMVELLRAMDKGKLQYYLSDLLGEAQLNAMWDRINGVLNVIAESEKNKTTVLVDKNDWNEDVAKRFSKDFSDYTYVSYSH